MEIILKKDIESLGKIGNVMKVADGYARNYLIPNGIAIQATSGNVKALEREVKIWQKKAEKHKTDAQQLAQEIEKLSIKFARKAGEDGRIFGSVTSMDIESGLKESGVQVSRKKIHVSEPIKTLGDFAVTVKLHQDVTANLKVTVVKE